MREQFNTFCLEHKINLAQDKWQISSRQIKIRNPANRSHLLVTQALWIDCTADMSRTITAAVKLLKPSHPSESAHPLLYNLLFVPAFNYMDIGTHSKFQMAQMQKKFVDSRFTYKVGNWTPHLNLYMDAPWKETDDGEEIVDQSIASLILSEAKGQHHNGKPFQLFSKIQASGRNKNEWHFQCHHEDSGLARHWLDMRLAPFLANKFTCTKNAE